MPPDLENEEEMIQFLDFASENAMDSATLVCDCNPYLAADILCLAIAKICKEHKFDIEDMAQSIASFHEDMAEEEPSESTNPQNGN